MEIEEAVLILVISYVAIVGFWLSGLSYLVLKKPYPVGVNGGSNLQISSKNGESLLGIDRKSRKSIKKAPVEVKEAPWEAEEETFEDDESRDRIEEKKSEGEQLRQKEAPLNAEGEVKPQDRVIICPTCKRKASFIMKYNRYYCYNCRKYLKPPGKKEQQKEEAHLKLEEKAYKNNEEEKPENDKLKEEKETQEDDIEQKVEEGPIEKEETASEQEEETAEKEFAEKEEQLDVIKELEEEANEQRREEEAKRQYEEQLDAPWKFEEELLNDEEAQGETDKEIKEEETIQDQIVNPQETEYDEEIRKEAQDMPIESEKKDTASVRDEVEEEVYECPVCGYEIGASTVVCPRCETVLHSDDE